MSIRIRTSKHNTKPFEGKVKLSKDSSFRKFARALRRGMLDPERMKIVEQAETNAKAETR